MYVFLFTVVGLSAAVRLEESDKACVEQSPQLPGHLSGREDEPDPVKPGRRTESLAEVDVLPLIGAMGGILSSIAPGLKPSDAINGLHSVVAGKGAQELPRTRCAQVKCSGTHLRTSGVKCAAERCQADDPACCVPKCIAHSNKKREGLACKAAPDEYLEMLKEKSMVGSQGTAYRVTARSDPSKQMVVKVPNPRSDPANRFSSRAWKDNNNDLATEFCTMHEVAQCPAGNPAGVMSSRVSAPCVDGKYEASGSYLTEAMAGDLAMWTRHRAPEEIRACAQVVAQDVYAGLECVHSAGWVHGDLKKDNIFYRDGSNCPASAVADFGLSNRVGATPVAFGFEYAAGSYHLPLFIFEDYKGQKNTYKATTRIDWCSFVFMIRQYFHWSEYAASPPEGVGGAHAVAEIDCGRMGSRRIGQEATAKVVRYFSAGGEDEFAPVRPVVEGSASEASLPHKQILLPQGPPPVAQRP